MAGFKNIKDYNGLVWCAELCRKKHDDRNRLILLRLGLDAKTPIAVASPLTSGGGWRLDGS